MKKVIFGKVTAITMLLGLMLGVSGCAATGDTITAPSGLVLLYRGPAQYFELSIAGLKQPGELSIVEAKSGDTIWQRYIPAEITTDQLTQLIPKDLLKQGRTYNAYYFPLNRDQHVDAK